MKEAECLTGQDLKEMFAAATLWLEKSAPEIDALNVYPVPDGDTGTNMLLTMRSSVEEAYRAPDQSTSTVAQAMAKGALTGARGNSGVILSQIWRGLAQSLAGKESLCGADLAEALLQASTMAYRGLSNPVEGTILTVIREAAEAARAHASRSNGDVLSIMAAVVKAAGEAVASTPSLLPKLREAGVVDAGGQGLYTILDGAYRYLRGEAEEMQYRKPQLIASSIPLTTKLPQMTGAEEVPYGYCTEFLLKGEELDPEKMRRRLNRRGQSLIVVGDSSTVRVHIHTYDPGCIIRYATRLGTLHQILIRNMDEQHQDFLAMQKERMPEVDTAIVAVVSGDGLADVFQSLGVTAVVPGGQTMNPSTKDLLRAVEAVPAANVIILPNDKNVVLTAEQVQSLTQKAVAVMPTETIPQGVAALLAFDYEADFKANTELMKKAAASVKTIQITRSIRSTQLNGMKIRKRQAIGFLDGDLIAVNDSATEVLNKMLARLALSEAEVITIYYGADTDAPEAEQVGASLRERYPDLQIEVVRGGQPHYSYIVSVE